MATNRDDYLADMMAKTAFVVEATHYERHTFWVDYHRFVLWEQHTLGLAVPLGEFGGMPVMAALSWADVAGRTVLFWELVSVVTHRGLWADWLKAHWTDPKWDGSRPAVCDADNFHHCLDAVGALDALRNNPAWQAEVRRRLG